MAEPETPAPRTVSSKPPPDGVEESPLSLRLRGDDEPPPSQSPVSERRKQAEKRVGQTLKSWRLTKLLGVGPITAAYEAARGVKDAKERAILKLMVGNVATHDRARSLFLRAAYAANRFNHARVLPITEDGTDEGGAPFVVRPWLEAETLEELVKRDPPDERTVLRIAEQLLDALEMAHAHGIVHGAISPTNVLITPRGSVRLCDFATPPGLGSTRSPDEDVLATVRTGPYVSPERSGSAATVATEATDVWNVGACLYFALTRKAPDRGDGGRVKPVRELAPETSEALALLVDHALMPDPLMRYESAYAMLGDVRRVMVGRKPKLADALAPVPSQSLAELPQLPPSSRRFPSSGQREMPKSGPLSMTSARAARRKQTRGNFVLVLAIAILVGSATFVLVREKMNDAKEPKDTSGDSKIPGSPKSDTP